ncbi:hypothetical protein BUALT_Bualt13G0101100 [Buddleja alternifolia]|uniref:Transcription repressor n=1 Tax=Buddleja alternifolia TaxID=168488 RepID=A0AAV6WLI4_9LAMI|nr:hypothetical protein BUALT_Bualt13G0101100 [Buddleja alternifolia]
MGNYKFRLSAMMPNAWFYKLKDMSKSKNQNPINKKLSSQLPQNPRKSFYNSPKNSKASDTHFPHIDLPPRKSSSKKRTKRKTIYMPSPRKISASISSNYDSIFQGTGNPGFSSSSSSSPDHQIFLESLSSSEFEYNFDDHSYDHNHESINEGLSSEFDYSCSCKLSSSATDIIFDMNEVSYETLNADRSAEFNMVSEPELRPILTKPTKQQKPPKFKKENIIKPKKTARKSVSRSGGVRIRGNSPKLVSKKNEIRKSVKGGKKGLLYSESFAIVKASFDPEMDFRESMMEMIVENNIRASKDLEELLACYLSLNSNQYHDLIIKAFEQIWFNMPD